jgi:hypothetical protein
LPLRERASERAAMALFRGQSMPVWLHTATPVGLCKRAASGGPRMAPTHPLPPHPHRTTLAAAPAQHAQKKNQWAARPSTRPGQTRPDQGKTRHAHDPHQIAHEQKHNVIHKRLSRAVASPVLAQRTASRLRRYNIRPQLSRTSYLHIPVSTGSRKLPYISCPGTLWLSLYYITYRSQCKCSRSKAVALPAIGG